MDSREILKNVVGLSMSAVEVSVSTAQILSGTREVQTAAISMASALEELAASIGDIEGTSRRTTRAVDESSALTSDGMTELRELGEDIVKTGDVFDQVATRTSDLHEVVENLGKVVELISKIAGHTDMLALNASIEAARAGVHGKSFAVVAEEVKSLSRQTSEATGTIKSQIRLLTTAFQEVIASVSDARAVVGRVVTQAAKVSEDFNRINANSSSISEQVRELSIIISQQREAIDLMANNMAVVKDKGEVNLSAVDQLVLQTDRSVGLIEDWRLRLADEDIQDKVILLAQADHLLWKKRLLDMAVGRSSMKSSDLTDHTLCRLGKWYYGQGSDGLRDLPAFQAIEEPHKRVHAHGIQAAKYFEQRMIDEGMREYAKLDAASRDVIADLQQLVSHARPIQQV